MKKIICCVLIFVLLLQTTCCVMAAENYDYIEVMEKNGNILTEDYDYNYIIEKYKSMSTEELITIINQTLEWAQKNGITKQSIEHALEEEKAAKSVKLLDTSAMNKEKSFGELDNDHAVNLILTRKQTKEVKANTRMYTFLPKTSPFDYLDLHKRKFYPLYLRVMRFPIIRLTCEER